MTRCIAKFLLGGSTTVAMALALAACGEPVPTAQMRSAADAIARAQMDGADQLAPQDLSMAQRKLSSAHSQVAADKNADARRLAEQAAVDAEYADVLSNAQRISNTASELQQFEQRQP